MEQNENKTVETAEATQVSHEETRKKLKKQRVRQIVASLIGVAILAFGLWKISHRLISVHPAILPRYASENIRKYTREIPSLCSTTGSIASV